MVAAWAEREMESVDLNDSRLDGRIAILLSDLGNHPNLSIPAACRGRAEMQAAYRFFDNDAVSFDKVLAPHIERTRQRIAGLETVLMIQYTTEADLTRPGQAVAGARRLDDSRRGILVHPLHAVTPDGTPLGTAWAQCLNRTEEKIKETAEQKRLRLKQTPIEEKESMRWLEGMRQSRAIAGQLPQTRIVRIGDSEAAMYELFAEPRGEPGGPMADWLIRACQDRALDSSEHDEHRKLLAAVSAAPLLYEADLLVRGRKAKVAGGKRERHHPRESRRATAQVRATEMTLRPPWRAGVKLPPVK